MCLANRWKPIRICIVNVFFLPSQYTQNLIEKYRTLYIYIHGEREKERHSLRARHINNLSKEKL